jgi:hypothetical protein
LNLEQIMSGQMVPPDRTLLQACEPDHWPGDAHTFAKRFAAVIEGPEMSATQTAARQ